jgi:hypothetical protein
VGILSIAVYVIVAFWLIGWLGFRGLVWADTAKQASHACLMIGLLFWQIGRFSRVFIQRVGQITLSALLMSAVMLAVIPAIQTALFLAAWVDVALVIGAGGAGLVSYLLILHLLGVGEVHQTIRWLHKMGRNKFTNGENQ